MIIQVSGTVEIAGEDPTITLDPTVVMQSVNDVLTGHKLCGDTVRVTSSALTASGTGAEGGEAKASASAE